MFGFKVNTSTVVRTAKPILLNFFINEVQHRDLSDCKKRRYLRNELLTTIQSSRVELTMLVMTTPEDSATSVTQA